MTLIDIVKESSGQDIIYSSKETMIVLGAFQPGDEARIRQAVTALDFLKCNDDRETKIKYYIQRTLIRLAEAAKLMEVPYE
jgi:hypothetical protein